MRSGKALKVLLSGVFSVLMKMDSKILNSVVFLDVPILSWNGQSWYIDCYFKSRRGLYLILDWGGLERGIIVKQSTYSEIIC